MADPTYKLRIVAAAVALVAVSCTSGATAGTATSPPATAAVPPSATVAITPSPAPLTGTLRFFGYEDAFDPSLLGPFQQANPGLTIKTSAISGDEEAVAKLKGGFVADMVNVCAGPVDEEIANGSLQPIDTSRITDWNQIYPFFKGIKGVDVNGKTYMLPMVGGAYGIVYRPSTISTPPTSWKDLFTSTKRITEPDDPLTNIILAGLALGFYPPQQMTTDQLAQVKQELIAQKPHVVTYYTGAALTTLWAQDEVDITPTDITLVDQMATQGGDAAFAPISPPLAWTCGYAIGAKAANLDAVYALLNWYLSPTVQGIQATKFSYLVSNENSAAALTADVLSKSGQNNIASFQNAATFGLPANNNAWTQLWQDVKAH